MVADVWVGDRAVEFLEFQIGAASREFRTADHVEVLVIPKAEIQGQATVDFPVVLKIDAELFGCDDEVRIAVGLAIQVTAPGVAKLGIGAALVRDGVGGFAPKSISSVELNSKKPPSTGFQM